MRALLALIALVCISGCGGGGDDSEATPAKRPIDFMELRKSAGESS